MLIGLSCDPSRSFSGWAAGVTARFTTRWNSRFSAACYGPASRWSSCPGDSSNKIGLWEFLGTNYALGVDELRIDYRPTQIALNFFFHLHIAIIGTLVLTVLLTLVFNFFQRR